MMSIRLALVRACRRHLNKAVELCTEYLRRHDVHPEPAGHVDQREVVRAIIEQRAHGQTDYAVVNARFGDPIDIRNGDVVVANFDLSSLNSHMSTADFSHLLSSQNINQGQSLERLRDLANNQVWLSNSLSLTGQSGLTNQLNALGKKKHG